MLTQGDVVELNLGMPSGPEAGLMRPAVVVTAEQVLRGEPNVIQVVPLTRTLRESGSEVVIEADLHNGLSAESAAQCQHIRSVATTRVSARIGNVGPAVLRQLRATVATLIDA
ncbi:type II toxin-antitoxin system PemK/MazF family toxin [Kocuria sp.]|uniref:type II toxin-antitoxin system PemK/MazF family toxin n=1 Tax=Kocuria sp. TaxID=1871328 RepID=UPI0026E029DA|nr:type II toxin-antitoxin system PemK/MazF family toxin [Kocuria sp.]MDO5618903.1 type II toxin-antitoxin system PemK/MazF family toxin [Kocuria sp.]